MIEKAREAVEAMKEVLDIFSKMELPVEERICTLDYEAVAAIIQGFRQLERERDAAVKALRGDCRECAHRGKWDVCTDCIYFCPFEDEGKKDNWQWRGVEVE